MGIRNSFFCSQECFKRNWSSHKLLHSGTVSNGTASYDPFPSYEYTGPLRPAYPLSPKRVVPDHIAKPDYHRDGIPRSEQSIRGSTQIKILTKEEQEGMRVVCRLAREVLDIAASHLKVGITTDEIDAIVHAECLKRNAYPSPLNYNDFPKSVCTSVNEVICHGIPDKRALKDGDIVNLDVTLYYNGYHGDLNETYLIGNVDEAGQRVVRTARECLEKAIAMVKPGLAFRDLGKVIEQHAKANNTSVVRTYCGHGIHKLFHCVPNIPHYTKNKAIGIAKPGMCFTIEPMINLGTFGDVLWPDHWTATTRDGQRSAQFEQTLLVTETGVEVLTAKKS